MSTRPPAPGRFRAATCRRWGDALALKRVARAEACSRYFARVKRRAVRARASSPSPCEAASSTPDAASPALGAGAACERPGPPPPQSGAAREAPPGRAQSGQSAEAALLLCPSFIQKAELREAPALFDDITGGGSVTAARAVASFPWTSVPSAAEANVFADVLDRFPRERSAECWSRFVVALAAIMFEDMCPEFRRVRLNAVEQLAQPFSLVPLRGRHGWVNRARWAGLR